jgi:hypothetical protein
MQDRRLDCCGWLESSSVGDTSPAIPATGIQDDEWVNVDNIGTHFVTKGNDDKIKSSFTKKST